MKRLLSELRVNEVGTILEIDESEISSRLMEFGVLPGNTLKVVSRAPLAGPICILVNNNRIALRRAEAKQIVVE